jgi:hypothetical protein
LKNLLTTLQSEDPISVNQQKNLMKSLMISGVAAGLSYIDMADGVDDVFVVGG